MRVRGDAFVLGGVGFVLLALSFSCGAGSSTSSFGDPTDPAGGAGGPGFDQGDGGAGGCVGLQCRQHACSGGGSTQLSGVVYDPAGRNPLYNVVVYVPNAPLAALPQGATCDDCSALYSGAPLVATTTDAAGKFTLDNVPDGANVPLVIQIGKWRKQLVVPSVATCASNALPDKLATLPKNGSEGDLPEIAISTGALDSLECLLRRVGVDASEYSGGPSGTGHIHIFVGGGILGGLAPNTSPSAPTSTAALWSSKSNLMPYDMVLLSCEGSETTGMNQGALFDYAAAGGRVFASHFHYAWFDSGPFGAANVATWAPGINDMGDINATIVTTLPDGSPFPKGQALAQWLANTGALGASGELPIAQAKHNADVGPTELASQAWIKADSSANPPLSTQYFTFNTPVGAKPESQCGRVVFSDLHVGAASGDYALFKKTVPDDCGTGNLAPQEKALEFMLFDLSSCVTPDDQPPTLPIVK